ncbi:MAG: hypothetical protein ACFBSE_23890 [Prochloraceae cyanobacterium]
MLRLGGFLRIEQHQGQELEAVEIDNWREYTLLKIDKNIDIEPIYLLKMVCLSTNYIHVLRVPPNMTTARVAITWVNCGETPFAERERWRMAHSARKTQGNAHQDRGIDPDRFAIET